MSSSAKPKLLAVDDDASFLALIDAVFSFDYEITRACDGSDGLRSAHKERPAVILLDINMPTVTGVEMLRDLQADLNTREIPVIVCTGSELNSEQEGAIKREPNVRSILRKPCKIDEIMSHVRQAIKRG